MSTSSTHLLELREYETTQVKLTEEAIRSLRDLSGNRLAVAFGNVAGTYAITATQHVGTFVTPEVTVLVHPKIPLSNLFLMLDVDAPIRTGTTEFDFGTDHNLLAAMAALFAQSVDNATGAGLVHAYQEHLERLIAMRGRIDMVALVRRPWEALPVACRFDEFTADIPENRFLKAAIRRMLRVPGVQPLTRRRLRLTLGRFGEVADTQPPHDSLDDLVYSRLNLRYRQPLRLARLVLANLGLADRPGAHGALSFTVDMNELFQNWVTDRLSRHLRGRLEVVPEPKVQLDVQRRVTMYPDLTFRQGQHAVYVGDVKYKLTDSGLGRTSDYYQLLAYTTAMKLPEGVLIYCQHTGDAPQGVVEVCDAGKLLTTYPLDLRGSRDDIEKAVADLADHIVARSCATEDAQVALSNGQAVA